MGFLKNSEKLLCCSYRNVSVEIGEMYKMSIRSIFSCGLILTWCSSVY